MSSYSSVPTPLDNPPAFPIGAENVCAIRLLARHARAEAFAFRKSDLLEQLVATCSGEFSLI
jgi:hypothetical protein